MGAMEKFQNTMRLKREGRLKILYQDLDKSSVSPGLTEPCNVEVSLKNRERFRHSLTFMMMIKYQTKLDNTKSKEILRDFLQNMAELHHRNKIFRLYWIRVDQCNRIVKRVLREHRIQNEVIAEQFEKVKRKIMADLVVINAVNAKTNKKDGIATEILDKLTKMDYFEKMSALSHYMNHCRRAYDEEIDKKRQKLREGITLSTANIILGGVFFPKKKEKPQEEKDEKDDEDPVKSPSPKKGKKGSKSKEAENFEDLMKIHNFD